MAPWLFASSSPWTFPQARGAAERCRTALLDQTGEQHALLRNAPDAVVSELGTNHLPVGRYWRCILAVFFNYGVDNGTVWKTLSFHEPVRWRHVSRGRQYPDREIKESCQQGWLYYRRLKTGKLFWRPMNRTVRLHLKSIRPKCPEPDALVFQGGGTRPNKRFRTLCDLAGVASKRSIESGEERPWVLKDLRKTCAMYYHEHVPESSIEILGHAAGGITYRHYAHWAPLAFWAITTLPQPTAFKWLARGFDGQCPCCRRTFLEAGA